MSGAPTPIVADLLGERPCIDRFVVLRDVEGRRHAVSAAVVGDACETYEGTLLMLPGGRMLQVLQVPQDLGTSGPYSGGSTQTTRELHMLLILIDRGFLDDPEEEVFALERLAVDLRHIANGDHPGEQELSRAPLLDH